MNCEKLKFNYFLAIRIQPLGIFQKY